MSLRPVPAHWFEAVVPRDDATRAIEALAMTGEVEIESRSSGRGSLELHVLREKLERFQQIARKHAMYWPSPAYDRPQSNLPPEALVDNALVAVTLWQEEAEHFINRIAAREEQRQEVLFCRTSLTRLAEAGLDINLLQTRSDFLSVVCCCVSGNEDMPQFSDVLSIPFAYDQESCRLAVVPASHADTFVRQMAAQNVICTRFPDWLRIEGDYIPAIDSRLGTIDSEIGELRIELDTLNEKCEMAVRLAEIKRMEWLVENVEAVEATDHFAWITGWTTATDAKVLNSALERAHIASLVHFAPAPENSSPPLMLRHPKWIRPFEMFSRALGMPGENEADPTTLLAVLVPLMFGYMFGDVGHGLVLLLLGVYLQRRWEAARILILFGVSAMVFGFLFGGLFSRGDVIPALWIHPLKHPLLVLTIPLVGGVILLSGGIVLNGLQARWRSGTTSASLGDAGFFVTYVGMMLAFVDTRFLGMAILGLCVYIGALADRDRLLSSLLDSLGHFLEMTFQILVNTLSFLRVGAFALAHEGLSSATSLLADSAGNPAGFLVIMILGNAVVIALEGLVVSIQTTRLVLFEFFVRFIRGTGRAFRPLPFPPSAMRGEQSANKT